LTTKPNLKIMIAGCPPKERAHVEATVKSALGPRAASGPWSLSLVKVGNQWSVSLDGPEPRLKGLSLVAPENRLKQAIAEALDHGRTDAGPASSPAPTPPAGEKRDPHTCPSCGRRFAVVYRSQPGESETRAPVACPHCWHVIKVALPEGAAFTQEYRAEPIQA
jgi:hypothetical protein